MQTHKQATATAPGLIYRIGAASMVTGVVISLSSGIFGGVASAGYLNLLEVIGADENTGAFLGIDPGRGIIGFLGAGMFFIGAFVYAFRMSIELLGFPVERHLSHRFTKGDKLALGIAAIGYVVSFLGVIPLFVLEEVFYDNPATTLTSVLNWILTASVWLMFGGLIIFFLKARHRLQSLYHRVISLGWGKLGWTRVNLTASSMILIAFTCQLFGWNSIFGLTMNTIIVTGFVIILSGVFPHFLARGKP